MDSLNSSDLREKWISVGASLKDVFDASNFESICYTKESNEIRNHKTNLSMVLLGIFS